MNLIRKEEAVENAETKKVALAEEKEKELGAPSDEEYSCNSALWYSACVYVDGVLYDLGISNGGGF